jgi:hypothetical protein
LELLPCLPSTLNSSLGSYDPEPNRADKAYVSNFGEWAPAETHAIIASEQNRKSHLAHGRAPYKRCNWIER